MVLWEHALELVWREVEDEQRALDGVRDEWKEGAREGRGEQKRKEGRLYHDISSSVPLLWRQRGVVHSIAPSL